MESPPLILGMAMPSIFIWPDGDFWASVCCAWQSDVIEANAQETSHAAANEDTDSSSATIEPANMRRIITPDSILRQSVSPLQPQEPSGIYLQSWTRSLLQKGF